MFTNCSILLGKNIMDVTKEELKRRFDKYNKLYFFGALGKCEFHFLNKNVIVLGKYNEKKNGQGRTSQIWLGQSVVWTDTLLKNVLIHEMVHMYNFTVEDCKFDGILGHGRHFRRQCRRLKRDYGLNISAHSFDCKVQYKVKVERAGIIWRFLHWLIDR